MTRPRALKLGLIVVLAISLTQEAGAFWGIGDIVFDPSVYAEAAEQILRMEQQYLQLVQSYQMLRSQYNHLTWMAKQVPVNMAVRYRAVVTPWRSSSATNTYGTTAGWIAGINLGQRVSDGYARATEMLGTYGSAFANLPADQRDRVRTQYGTVELTDGANLSGLETLGQLRQHAPAVESALQGLEDDSLSADPDMNTEIAVLNKINAAHLVAVRTGQDTNKLLAALAEHQIIDATRARDAEVRAINDHIRFVAEGRAVMTAQAAGASQAMLDWRMP